MAGGPGGCNPPAWPVLRAPGLRRDGAGRQPLSARCARRRVLSSSYTLRVRRFDEPRLVSRRSQLTRRGDGIANLGALTLTNATLFGNHAGYSAGGIYSNVPNAARPVRLTNVTLAANTTVSTRAPPCRR